MPAYLVLLILLGVFSQTTPAYAYLDPGSASIAIQAILAGIAGGLATIKFWGHKIKAIFQRKTSKEEENRINEK